MLNSTIWLDRDSRDIFITALLMAVPHELRQTADEIVTRSLEHTGWSVPPGWYGVVPAAGIGIISRCGSIDPEAGYSALEKLASVDLESRTPAFDGRRMVRINGGFIVLNFFKHRDRDHTAPDRMRRFRERNAAARNNRYVTADNTRTLHPVTQAEAEAEAETYKEG